MKESIKLFLDWSLPLLCFINIFLNWGDTTLALAWLVAFTGWFSSLLNKYSSQTN